MGTFGTLARRLPQDPVQELPSAYPFFRRAEIDDRRGENLSAIDEARILMGLIEGKNPQYPAANTPVGPATPLAIDAGLLDVKPSHERWLAERIGAQPNSISVSTRDEAAGISTHQKARPAQRYMDLIDPPAEK